MLILIVCIKKYYWHNNTIYWGRKLEYLNQYHSRQHLILHQQSYNRHQVFPPTHPQSMDHEIGSCCYHLHQMWAGQFRPQAHEWSWHMGHVVSIYGPYGHMGVGASQLLHCGIWAMLLAYTSDVGWPVQAVDSRVVGHIEAALPFRQWSLAKGGRVDHMQATRK